ncbi:MAG: vitamin K epoxide reductase family protein [Ignavibacteria bacterium]|nr:vitamin K epoxide reductase family protein [Ignavibacteria bacterium]
MVLERWLLFAASIVGIWISLGFALLAKGVLSPRSTFLPRFCRLDETQCAKIFSAPEARLFSLPNFWLGLIYYSLLLVASISQFVLELGLFGFFFASLVTVAVGVYLTYILLVKMQTRCLLCFIAHVLNMIVSLILLSLL